MQTTTHKTAVYLAWSGLLPFVIVLLSLLLTDNLEIEKQVHGFIIAYASLILCFVGAVHWGVLLNSDKQHWHYIIAILPMLFALISLLVPHQYGLGILFFSFLSVFHYEKAYLWSRHFPEWYQQIRTRLSFSVSGILLLIWILSLN